MFEIDKSHEDHWRIACDFAHESERPAEGDKMAEAIAEAVDTQPRPDRICFDLTGWRFVDSRGIAFLVELRRQLLEKQVVFSVVNASPAFWRAMALLNLEDAFPLGTAAAPNSDAEAAASDYETC